MLYKYIHPNLWIHRKNVFFWKLRRNDPSDVVDFPVYRRFQSFTLNPQMFAVRDRFANLQTKTFSLQFADLRTNLRKCPALVIVIQTENCVEIAINFF